MEGTSEQKNATQEARHKELENYQRALDTEWLDSRMDDGRLGRSIALIERKAEMEKDFQERTDQAAIVNARAEKETKLGLEVAKLKREEMSLLLKKYCLSQKDPSIKELMKNLGPGYVSGDLKLQILHNEYRRLQEKAEDNYANAVVQKALYSDKEAMVSEEKAKTDRNAQYSKELQQQMVSRQHQRQCHIEDTIVEKIMMDEISRNMADEDQRELQNKRKETSRMRDEMVSSTQARQDWKDQQKVMNEIEDRQIEHQRQAASDRNSSVIAERDQKMHIREDLNQKICDKIMFDKEAREERENIIELLHEQAHLDKNAQDDQAERDNTARVKKEMKDGLEEQIENKKQDVRNEKIVEAEYKKRSDILMAAGDEREREKMERVKEEGRQYGRDLRQQIEENAQRRAEEKKLERARERDVWNYDREWRAEVSQEHNKVVSEHAPIMLGTLQDDSMDDSDLQAQRDHENIIL